MATSPPGRDEDLAVSRPSLLALTGEQPQITYPILLPGTVDTPRQFYAMADSQDRSQSSPITTQLNAGDTMDMEKVTRYMAALR